MHLSLPLRVLCTMLILYPDDDVVFCVHVQQIKTIVSTAEISSRSSPLVSTTPTRIDHSLTTTIHCKQAQYSIITDRNHGTL
jgi:hypothetical protein